MFPHFLYACIPKLIVVLLPTEVLRLRCVSCECIQLQRKAMTSGSTFLPSAFERCDTKGQTFLNFQEEVFQLRYELFIVLHVDCN